MAEYIKREDALKIADEYYDHPIGKAIAKSIFCLPAADVATEREFRDCRNELCLRCGNYKERHLGACDGCRWRC